jgi:hypothetical protein
VTPTKLTPKEWLRRIIFFFPFQLFLAQLKRNHITLLLWIFLFMLINGQLGARYGLTSLFLYPEYLNEVGPISHLLLGFAVGGFIVAFNISNYIINGYRFPVIATMSNPFYKFSLNNGMIPLIFLLNHILTMWSEQVVQELEAPGTVVLNIAAYLGGVMLLISTTIFYFLRTDKGILKFVEKKRVNKTRRPKMQPAGQLFGKNIMWYRMLKTKEEGWTIKTYLAHPFKIQLARSSNHYNIKTLLEVFTKNHINATLFEVLILITIFTMGLFHDVDFFLIPAAASILLLFTVLILISGATYTWLKGWSSFFIIALLVLANYGSQYAAFRYRSSVYGLKYNGVEIPYTNDRIQAYADSTGLRKSSFEAELKILDNWKAKQNVAKPKLILLNVSGGGLRSAFWTFYSLQKADSSLGGALMTRAHMLSGSSGGMIGAAYFRELGIRGLDPYEAKHRNNMSSDLLNPVAFTIAVNDIFPRWQNFKLHGEKYLKDRAYAFERSLNQNLGGIINKRMGDYAELEAKAQIPSFLFAPTINNDGRRLLSGTRSYAFLTKSSKGSKGAVLESIDLHSFMSEANPERMKLSSMLRMSATFPYVFPNASMPTVPEIEMADAGLRDNFGFVSSVQYVMNFQEWIEENTSGVVILQLRDLLSEIRIRPNPHPSLIQALTSPLGGFYNNWVNIQEYNQEEYRLMLQNQLDVPLEVLSFEMDPGELGRVSLSWHLTKREKNAILDSWNTAHNQAVLKRLEELLN